MSIRAQVTISHIPLSGRMSVEVVDAKDYTFKSYGVEQDDAEYQLLAQAIDRFVAVAEERRKVAAAEKDAALVQAAMSARIEASRKTK